jgi:hypothetical protein
MTTVLANPTRTQVVKSAIVVEPSLEELHLQRILLRFASDMPLPVDDHLAEEFAQQILGYLAGTLTIPEPLTPEDHHRVIQRLSGFVALGIKHNNKIARKHDVRLRDFHCSN